LNKKRHVLEKMFRIKVVRFKWDSKW